MAISLLAFWWCCFGAQTSTPLHLGLSKNVCSLLLNEKCWDFLIFAKKNWNVLEFSFIHNFHCVILGNYFNEVDITELHQKYITVGIQITDNRLTETFC